MKISFTGPVVEKLTPDYVRRHPGVYLTLSDDYVITLYDRTSIFIAKTGLSSEKLGNIAGPFRRFRGDLTITFSND
jgi:hypothetical protein